MSNLFESCKLLFRAGVYKSGYAYSIKPTGADGRIPYSRTGTTTRINSTGLIEEVADGVPTISFDDYGQNPTCPIMRVDESRTNYVKKSNSIDVAESQWSGSFSTIDSTITAPNGSEEGKVYAFEGNASDNVRQGSLSLTAATDYDFFFWAKKPSGEADTPLRIIHNDGAASNELEAITIDSTDWKLYKGRFTATAHADEEVGIYNDDASPSSAKVAFWGANVQQAKGRYYHIETDTAAVTRGAESITWSDLQTLGVFGSLKGSFLYDGTMPAESGNILALQIRNAANTDRFAFSSNRFLLRIDGVSTTTTAVALDPTTDGEFDGKIAWSWNADGVLISVNGSTLDPAGLTMTNFDASQFTHLAIGGNFCKRIRRMAGWDIKLNQTDLNNLTA